MLPPAGALKAAFDDLLTSEVRPMLAERGFAKSGVTFTRRRGDLYDVINFQGSDASRLGLLRRYVNVGIGSVAVDAASGDARPARPALDRCVFERRWEQVARAAPERIEIRPGTDLDGVRGMLRDGLSQVVSAMDEVTTTGALLDLAIERNGLQALQQICAYLASTGDVARLRRHIAKLRARFGADLRWPIFNDQLYAAAGDRAPELQATGLLDEPQ